MPRRGELIGPYRLIAPLGAGAMGEVWRARDERLQRQVALKVLPAHAAGDVERRARMLREARAAAAIRHAGVVTLFDIVAHEQSDILVMELVEGRTINDLLQRGAPELPTALSWIEQIADALVAAHACGVLHRDIKAANIMVTAEGTIKVLDFGVAKLHEPEVEVVHSARRISRALAAATAQDISLEATAHSSDSLAETRDEDSLPPATPLALEATRPSGPIDRGSLADDLASYRTQVGSLIGTPLYMSPEQVTGRAPDERSEIFSLGVLAYQIVTGKVPYVAANLDELFAQVATASLPPMAGVPDDVAAILKRALAKNPTARWPTMVAFRDALAAERRRRFATRRKRWPLAVAAAGALAGVAGGALWWRASREPAARPGDGYIARALEEYDLFYTDKALSSLRAALAMAPDHPRASAYLLLVGSPSDLDRATTIAAAKRARERSAPHSKDRALLDAGLALAQHGAAAAQQALVAAGAARDRELAFWSAELSYRAGNYTAASDDYRALLAERTPPFRGRIYDRYSSVLMYLDQPLEALRIGTLYRQQFPGEADAVGAHAMTLSAAGRHAEAIEAAEATVRLAEREDTLAGLAKIVAVSGDRVRAKDLYRRSINQSAPARRPLRRAALAMLHWIDGELDAARATVAPCLTGDDAAARERATCLFVAGIVDPTASEALAAQLDGLAASATELAPAYGAPTTFAKLLRARLRFFAGACVVDPARRDLAPPQPGPPAADAYSGPADFYASYYLPFYATWAICERAAWLASTGDRAGAAKLLRTDAERAPNRSWIAARLAQYTR